MRTGSGALVISNGSRRMLVGKRAPFLQSPLTWSNWGGYCWEGETPADVAEREFREETGFKSPIDFRLDLSTYESDSIRYHNYLFIVRNEFRPTLTDETLDFMWTQISQLYWLIDIGRTDALHPGFVWTLKKDREKIQKFLDEI
jgi:8-oxo-dGTP pyrophosphatase MutT (NUDIX family)